MAYISSGFPASLPSASAFASSVETARQPESGGDEIPAGTLLAVLDKVAAIARQPVPAATALPQIAEVLARSLAADGVALWFLPATAPAGTAAPVKSYWYPRAIARTLRPAQQQQLYHSSAFASLPADGKIQIENHVLAGGSSLPPAATELWARLHARHLLCLRIGDDVESDSGGVLSMWRAIPWTGAQARAIAQLYTPLALALDRVCQRQTQRQQQRHALTQAQLHLVEQFGQILRGSPHVQPLLDAATRTLTDNLPVRRSLALLLTYSQPQFHARTTPRPPLPHAKVRVSAECRAAGTTAPAADAAPTAFWLADCAGCRTAIARAPELWMGDAPETGDSAAVLERDRFAEELWVPLLSPGRQNAATVLGFLVLQDDRPQDWDADRRQFVQFVGRQLSHALIQRQTLQQVRGLVRDRTAQLQRSLSVQATLYDQTRRQLDQLRQLNQQKDEFLSAVSHELRTPLTSMTLAIRMLRQGDLSPERQQRYLGILEQQCHQESQLVRDLLKLQELEGDAPELHVEAIALSSLLRERQAEFEGAWSSKRLTLELEVPAEEVWLHSDRSSLQRILDELLANAGKYAFQDTGVRARLSCDASGTVSVALSNLGEGIRAEDLPHIFEKFYRGEGVTQQAIAGTGLGLALVQNLVQLLQGTVEVQSEAIAGDGGAQTCFTVTLPSALSPETDGGNAR